MVALTAIAWVPCTLVAAFREHDRPKLFFFCLGARRDGGAGRVPGPGPGAVHRLLRPDAGAVLLHDRRLGLGRPRARHHQVRDLHVGRVAADARCGDRAGRAVDARRAARSRSRSPSCSSARSREGTQHWIVLLFALAFFVKAPLFPLHGWVPETYRSSPIVTIALLGGVLSKVGVYGFLRIVLPIMPEGALSLAGAVHHRGGLLDPLRVDPRLLPGQRAAGHRLLLDRPDGLHRAGHLRPGRQGRPGRGPPDAQPRARRRAAVPDHRRRSPPAPAAASRSPSWAGWRSARRCWRRCS